MNKYFIYAVEDNYQGLHGMYECEFVEAESPAYLEYLGCEMSVDVMHCYSIVMEELEEEARRYTNDMLAEREEDENYDIVFEKVFEETLEDMIGENILYYIYKVKDEYKDCAEEAYKSRNLAPEEVIELYCEEGEY